MRAYKPDSVSLFIGDKEVTTSYANEQVVTLNLDLPIALDLSFELEDIGKVEGTAFLTKEQFELFKEKYNVAKSY